jgi:hypothetical protein
MRLRAIRPLLICAIFSLATACNLQSVVETLKTLGKARPNEIAYYVSTDGNDQWSGKLPAANRDRSDGPLATLETARDRIRSERQAGHASLPYTVYLRGGVYERSSPFSLSEPDSGSESSPTLFTSYPGEKAEIRGSHPLGKLAPYQGGIYVTSVDPIRWPGAFRSLFVNGVRATRARAPNQGYFATQGPPAGGTFGFRYVAGTFNPNLVEIGNTEAVVIREWSQAAVLITALSPTQVTVRDLGFDGPGGNAGGFYLENSLNALDSPGEWYLDASKHLLYYWPKPGEDPSNLRLSAPIATTLVEAVSKDGTVSNLAFEDLSFSETDWAAKPFPDIYHFSQAAQNAWFNPGSIVIRRGRRIAISKCSFSALGGTYAIDAYGSDLLFDSNILTDLAGGAFRLGRDSDAEYKVPATPNLAVNNIVSNNRISRVSKVFKEAPAINGQMLASSSIVHNLISDVPYTGISVGWQWDFNPTSAHDVHIDYNRIQNVVQELKDGAGIYTLGLIPNSTIHHNLVSGSGNFSAIAGAPILDFGGMYSPGHPNPATGGESCPAGYTTTQDYGSPIDQPLFSCVRPHNPDTNTLSGLEFGGLYGDSTHPNPFTGAGTCPGGYASTQVYGGSYGNFSDRPIYLCSRPPTPGQSGEFIFGGLTGFINTGAMSSNPLYGMGSTLYCPSGYAETQLLNTTSVDWPLDFCYLRRNLAHGVYLDEGTQGFSVKSNEVVSVATAGLMLHNVRGNSLSNNVVIRPRTGGVQLTQRREVPGRDNVFTNNMFYLDRPETKILHLTSADVNEDLAMVSQSDFNHYFVVDAARSNEALSQLRKMWPRDVGSRSTPFILVPEDSWSFRINAGQDAFSTGFVPIPLSEIGPK